MNTDISFFFENVENVNWSKCQLTMNAMNAFFGKFDRITGLQNSHSIAEAWHKGHN